MYIMLAVYDASNFSVTLATYSLHGKVLTLYSWRRLAPPYALSTEDWINSGVSYFSVLKQASFMFSAIWKFVPKDGSKYILVKAQLTW